MYERRFLCVAIRLLCVRSLAVLLLAASAAGAFAQAQPKFSGTWKQDNDRCQPKRKGDVTLRIEQDGEKFTVETSIAGNSSSRHAMQKYTTDGIVSTSTGADGDTFDTSVVWSDSSLVFSIKEHEDGRILLSKERWSLRDGGATLEKTRERSTGERQTVIFNKVRAMSSVNNSGSLKQGGK